MCPFSRGGDAASEIPRVEAAGRAGPGEQGDPRWAPAGAAFP